MPPSHRIPVLATKIAAHIQGAGLSPGTPMTERRLAEQFHMSRTPVKLALRMLAERGVVEARGQGGFAVAALAAGAVPPPIIAGPEPDGEEATYLALARDHVAALVPARITENALIRRYGLTRHGVARILHRAAREGWAERLPGHGWRLLPVLTSAEAYAQAYRYRILVEPAGILEPGFVADRAALGTCRRQQLALLDSDPDALATARMFDTASDFHEVVMRCSNNPFLIDGLTRLTRLRRLLEYGKSVDRRAWLHRCAEHVAIIDHLLDGDRAAAAAALRAHLEGGASSKVASSRGA